MSVGPLPAGAIAAFAGGTVPSGWLACDGSQYNVSTYPDLYAQIGVKFGGTLDQNFLVPNLGGRVVAGQKASASGSGIDGTVGAWTGRTGVTLAASEGGVVSHNHGVTDPGHTHTPSWSSHSHKMPEKTMNYSSVKNDFGSATPLDISDNGGFSAAETPLIGIYSFTNGSPLWFYDTSVNVSIVSSAGAAASQQHTNMQPYVVAAYIIKS